jgi:hypothetical protein
MAEAYNESGDPASGSIDDTCTPFEPPLMSAPPLRTWVPAGQNACAHLKPCEPVSELRAAVTTRPLTAEASVAITTDAALAARIAPAIRIRSLRLRATAWVTSRSSGRPKHHDARKDPAPGQSSAAAHAGCARRPIGHRSCGCPNGARSDPRQPGLDHAGSTRLGSDNAVTPAGLFHTKSVPVQRAL